MKVIFDTDAGVDDATALMVALHHLPPGTVECVTTVFGNVNVAQASHNARYLLKVMNQPEIPVYTGASRAMVKSVIDYTWAGHGLDGLGNQSGAIVQDSTLKSMENEAVPVLLRKSHEFKGELVLVAVGPLTNIAMAIAMDPTFLTRIQKIYVMGGLLYAGRGNFTDASEFNVGKDPEATDIVYKHCTADQLTVVPWETCLDSPYTWQTFDEVFEDPRATTPAAKLLREAWKPARVVMQEAGFVPCDVYATAIFLNEHVAVTKQRMHVSISLNYDVKRGLNLWKSREFNCPKNDAELVENVVLVTEVDRALLLQQIQNVIYGENGSQPQQQQQQQQQEKP